MLGKQSGNDFVKRCILSCLQNGDDSADVASSGRSFQNCGLTTEKLSCRLLIACQVILWMVFCCSVVLAHSCTVLCSCRQSFGRMKRSIRRHQQQQLQSRYLLELIRGHLDRICFGHLHVLMVHTSVIQV